MKELMIDDGSIDRIINETIYNNWWQDKIHCQDLKCTRSEHSVMTAKKDPNKIVIHEGTVNRWVDVRAINFFMIGLWDPKMAFQLVREKAPNNGDELVKSCMSEETLFKAPKPQLKEDYWEVARPLGFVKDVCEMASFLAHDDRQDNYTYRLLKRLAIMEHELNIGTNTRYKTKEFYGWVGPIRIVVDAEVEEEQDSKDAGSAAEANW